MNRFACLIAAAALVAGAGAAGATTIHVPGDQPTIQAGINAAAFGDTVLVSPGYYVEKLHMKNGVALVGSRTDMPVIHSPDQWSVVHCLEGVLGPETRVEGFVIEGATRDVWASGFRCDDGSATIRYNVIRDCNMGVQLKESRGHAVVDHNTIVGNHDCGVILYNGDWLVPTGTSVIRNNIIAANDQFGIYRWGDPFPLMPDADYNDVWGNGENYHEVPVGAHDISADPIFCGPGVGNYLINSLSPCAGAGEMGTDMGALGVGCGEPVVAGEVWGSLSWRGSPLIQWVIPSLEGISGLDLRRATVSSGPYESVLAWPLPPSVMGSYEDMTAWPDATFWYRLVAILADSTEAIVGGPPVSVATTGVPAETGGVLELAAVGPNPFRDFVAAELTVPGPGCNAELAVYTVSGERLTRLHSGYLSGGTHSFAWDGSDARGLPAASGVYMLSLEWPGGRATRKLVLLR